MSDARPMAEERAESTEDMTAMGAGEASVGQDQDQGQNQSRSAYRVEGFEDIDPLSRGPALPTATEPSTASGPESSSAAAAAGIKDDTPWLEQRPTRRYKPKPSPERGALAAGMQRQRTTTVEAALDVPAFDDIQPHIAAISRRPSLKSPSPPPPQQQQQGEQQKQEEGPKVEEVAEAALEHK